MIDTSVSRMSKVTLELAHQFLTSKSVVGIRTNSERDIWQQRTSSRQATKTELATIVAKSIESSVTESNIKAGFCATGIWPLDAMAIRFEGKPSNHITIHEDPCTTASRENFSDEVEYPSQVASTPLNQTSEGEAILALKNLAAQLDADIMRVHGELDSTSMIGQGEVEPSMTFTQLLEEGDITNYQGKVGDENRNSNHTHQSRQHEQSKTIDLLKVPTSEVCIRQVNCEAFVDYTNSLILTSTQYMDSMRAKTARKEELAKAKETKRLDKEKKRAQFLAEKETARQKRLDAQQARQSRKAWEIQQQAFEARLRICTGLYFWFYLTKVEEAVLKELLKEFKDIFAWTYHDMKGVPPSVVQHTIPMISTAKPVQQRPYPMNPKYAKIVQEELEKLIQCGFIYPIEHSEWVSPIIIVPKENGKLRVCVDLKKVNAATRRDHYPLPYSEHVLERVAGKEAYSFLDGYSGYNQITIA
ncbi:hypothetical protein L7F22_007994 [Adiantum nelumboides]|nr:hypothetical protein [Adiantum nelumboides]